MDEPVAEHLLTLEPRSLVGRIDISSLRAHSEIRKRVKSLLPWRGTLFQEQHFDGRKQKEEMDNESAISSNPAT
jgi:hypothetical protein